MENMDVDSSLESSQLKPRDRILQRLALLGIPADCLPPGLVEFVKDDKTRIPELVSAILPTDEEMREAFREAKAGSKKASTRVKRRFRDNVEWLKWLMFEGDPAAALKHLSKMSVGQRGVCGAVWGNNDVAYRCRTCEHDPTCAICVPCFQNGNHKHHDYSIIYTGGGCCDCGDITAWKREGFCSKHKGAEQIRPLPEEFAKSVGPILNALFICWKEKLMVAETTSQENPRAGDRIGERMEVANELTFMLVEMLLEFCKYSESLLSFVSRVIFSSVGLLENLVRAERLLREDVVKKLSELLLKLLGEPLFKYEFAKVFMSYYPNVVNDAINEGTNHALKKYPLLSTFSVQILTVPTLTPRLVKEMNLLAMLLGCLGDIFFSCAGEDDRLQVAKWGNLYETTIRVLEDVRFVMSHAAVAKYITHDQKNISKTWMRLLAFVQGMNPQKRETGLHIEEDNENIISPFALCHSIANIHSLLVDGAFSAASSEETDDDILSNTYKQDVVDADGLRHAKVGRLSEESSACSATWRSSSLACASEVAEFKPDAISYPLIPPTFKWLMYECLRAIDNWLVDSTSGAALNELSPNTSSNPGSNFSALKETLSKIRKGKYIFRRQASSTEDHDTSHVNSGFGMILELQNGKSKDNKLMTSGEIDTVNTCCPAWSNDSLMEGDTMDIDALRVLSLSDWPNISYNVSSQDISVHIPLHRLLSLLLQKALRRCFGESAVPNMTSDSSANSSSTSCIDFFQHVLGGCHPFGFSAFVMEHLLRVRVFCAEVHAGMWRKNGDTALYSCEWYRSVRWSGQGIELDLFLLQCCAALAPPDLFINRIIERFGLSNYLSLNLERSNEYEPVLVQEMLTLIIQIVNERRFCGLTTAESLKRELIFTLAVGDATRSQLVKSLPRGLSKFNQLQEILDTVAAYSNPSGFNQGMYSLRWTYWKELDLYHPRWNPRDLQVAEERYFRFCSVSPLTSQLPRWTKIYPPLKEMARVTTCKAVLQIIRAVLFYAIFTDKGSESRAPHGVLLTALHLLSLALDICYQQRESSDQSCSSMDEVPILTYSVEEIWEGLNYGAGGQSLLSLLVFLMRMEKNENVNNFFDTSSCNLSSLIASILKKFAEIDSGCMAKLQQLAPEVVNCLSQSKPSSDTNISGSASDSEKRKAKARERQAAILEKMRAEQSKFLASMDSAVDESSKSGQVVNSSDVGDDSEQTAEVVCSLCHDPNSKDPMSFLILLQKSRLVSFVDRGPPSWDKFCRLEKEHVSAATDKVTDQSGISTSSGGSGLISSSPSAQLVQNAVNEYSLYGQPEEVNAFVDFVKAWFPAVRDIQVPRTSNDGRERTVYSMETLEQDMYFCIRREMHDTLLHSNFTEDDNKLSTAEGSSERRKDAESVLLGKYIAALSRAMKGSPSASEDARKDKASVESTSKCPAYDGFGPSDGDGVHISSCGHALHQGCLDRYLASLKERYVRRIVFEGGHIVDPALGEFLCPVCRRLANSVMPALPGDFKDGWEQSVSSTVSYSCAAGPSAASSEEISSLRIQQALALLQSAANVVGKDEILKALPLQGNGGMRSNLESVRRVFSKMYYPNKQDKLSQSERVSHSMLMWDTLKYSIVTMEIAARCGRTHMTPNYGLNAMYEELKSSSGFILSLLLKNVQNARSKNALHVLQRFRGIQLFAESICSGKSLGYASSTSGQGNILGILKHLEMKESFPDTQFWNRASDPVLSGDPFSSLMWAIFCLPYPFLSCEESMLSLVHVFYAISVVQAIITYCGIHHCKTSELGFNDCLISDICKVLGESGCAQQYFVSRYIGPSSNIRDTIRSLSFPYLRRCALLWKLLNASAPAPFYDRDNVFDRSSVAINDMMDITDGSLIEFNEIQQLENLFKIPPLDVVLKEEILRPLALKWVYHFCEQFKVRGFGREMHITPAIPFKLMHLPHLYQDVLQRLIKQRCPDCKSTLGEPALCLLCGRLCSPSWKSCCSQSGCQAHAMVCGAGTGVFLLIRKTTILLQRSARQSPWPSPYLDTFGEEDIDMHRGKPLYLNEERYAALTYMVASHGLDRSSKVLHQTTIGSFFTV
ncbi:E3 ubiquitin-protein ligase PRT6 isoform X2 [Corylus avellana]|uniref:E3 ubiquitin-protein ligase PRT6 isoform X2 n=1 Tax=Corylus avellana TaxID=13451 RepID=UPI00286C79F8|nr:E3 ubiquitin-protein ligase PRT6 isoform X2 [Corylus avellana]